MAAASVSTVIRITSLAPSSTDDKLKELFEYVGTVKRVYVSIGDITSIAAKEAYVEFDQPEGAALALHLTSLLWIDRPITIDHVDSWPGEAAQQPLTADAEAQKIVEAVPRLSSGSGPVSVGGVATAGPDGIINLGNTDPNRVEEIRRTIYCGNLDSKTVTADHMMQFFKLCGTINFVRMAGDETQPTRFAFIEFTTHEAANSALMYNGAILEGRPMKVNHSKNAIVKPPTKKAEVQAKEYTEAQRKIQEAAAMLAASLTSTTPSAEDTKGDRRASVSDRDYRDRDRARDSSRARERERGRDRDSRRSRRSRSRSTSKRSSRTVRSRSRERRRSSRRSRSPRRDRDRRHRSRSKSPRKDGDKSKTDDDKDKSSDSKAGSDKADKDVKKDKDSKDSHKERSRDKDRDSRREKDGKSSDKHREKSRGRDRDRDRSRNRDRSRSRDRRDRDKRSKRKTSETRDRSKRSSSRGADKHRDRDSESGRKRAKTSESGKESETSKDAEGKESADAVNDHSEESGEKKAETKEVERKEEESEAGVTQDVEETATSQGVTSRSGSELKEDTKDKQPEPTAAAVDELVFSP